MAESSEVNFIEDSSYDFLDLFSAVVNSTSSPPNQSKNATSDDDCIYYPNDYLQEKFALVAVFGTCVCVFGLINNCLLFFLLLRSPLLRSHVFYLAVLAICDMIAEFSYMAVIAAQVIFDYTENVQLYIAWNKYLRIVFTMTHVSLAVSTYMIVSASAERYLTFSNFLRSRSCARRHRWLVTFAVFLFAFLSKGLVYWEIEVIHNKNCTGFSSYQVTLSSLAMDPPYKIGYTLWFRHIVHVFFPFVLLLCLNSAILSRLKRRPIEKVHAAMVTSAAGQSARQRKKNIRSATMMLAAIVTTYLISNVLNIVITLWEHIDLEYLHSQRRFYTFAVDTINILTVFTSAIRFPIYCACNQQLRMEFIRLCDYCYCKGKKIGEAAIKCFKGKKEKECEKEESDNGLNINITTPLTAFL